MSKLVAIAVAPLAVGCGFGSALALGRYCHDPCARRDFGHSEVAPAEREDARGGETGETAAERNFKVSTKYGGGSAQEI